MQAYVLTLYLSQVLLQHSRLHVYTPSWSETREYLSKLTKELLAEIIMQEVLQSRLNFSQYRFFLSIKKQLVRLNFLFQRVTCKRAEVKRADSKEPTFYLNYKIIIYDKFCGKLIWFSNENTTFEYWKK